MDDTSSKASILAARALVAENDPAEDVRSLKGILFGSIAANAGRSDGGDSRGARNGSDVVPENSQIRSGGRTGRRADAGGVARPQRCSAGQSGAGDFAEDAEARRVVSACPREDTPER